MSSDVCHVDGDCDQLENQNLSSEVLSLFQSILVNFLFIILINDFMFRIPPMNIRYSVPSELKTTGKLYLI